MDEFVLEEKSSCKMLGLTFSSKLLKLHPIKLEPLLILWSFSSEVVLYLYKSTIWPSMEYFCHVWAGAPGCFWESLDKLQKWICKTVVPSIAASYDLLAHHQNVSSLSLFYRYYKCYKNVDVNSFFPHTTTLECLPLNYDLHGSKSRINRHLLNICFFLNRFPASFNLFCASFSCKCLLCNVFSALYGVIPIKKAFLVNTHGWMLVGKYNRKEYHKMYCFWREILEPSQTV